MPLTYRNSFAAEVKATAKLGFPLALGELGWMSTYIVDALMIGRMPHSALAISASSLGNTIFYAIAFCAIELLTGLETLVAQAYGRGDERSCFRTLGQAFWFVAAGTPLVMGATWASIYLLPFFGTPSDIVAETRSYLHALVWSTAPLLLYWALRRYLQSINRVGIITISLLSASLVNAAGDWLLLYGHGGIPSLGVAGSGWATCIVRVYTAVLLLAALRFGNAHFKHGFNREAFRLDKSKLRTLLWLGWPAALRSLANLSVSTCQTILCARLGATLLAAHQVVLDLSAFAFMAPLGLSYATATRVGQSAGRGDAVSVRRAAQASLLLGLSITAVVSILFAVAPRFWAGLYTNDSAAVSAAAPIFLMCSLIVLGDAAGVLFNGALVGVGDTRSALASDTVWSWVIGMPIAYWLAFHTALTLRGLWTGRLIAAWGSGLTLALVWKWRTGKRNPQLQAMRMAS